MLSNVFLILLALVFLTVIFAFYKKRKKFFAKEEVESVHESEEYIEEAQRHEMMETSEESEGDDRRDIYNKKTPKNNKKGSYETKNYRGTDIEIAGFESKKDLKELQRDDLTTIESKVLDKELEKERERADLSNKAPEVLETDPEAIKSGVAGKEAAMAKIIKEIKENYKVNKSHSALDNFSHSVKQMKKENEGGRGM